MMLLRILISGAAALALLIVGVPVNKNLGLDGDTAPGSTHMAFPDNSRRQEQEERPKARLSDTFSVASLREFFSRRPSPSKTKRGGGGIRTGDLKARLDNYSVDLQNDPSAQGYIIPLSARRESDLTAAEGQRLIDYLVNVRGMDAGRLVLVSGMEAREAELQCWIVPAGAEPPPLGK